MSKRSGKSPSQRQLRVGEDMRHSLAMILERADFRDPALQGISITVTEIRVSPDLRNATIFVTPLGGENTDEVVEGLNRASGHLRSELSRVSTMKYLPRLNFLRDESFDEAMHINSLLHDPLVSRDLDKDEEDQDS